MREVTGDKGRWKRFGRQLFCYVLFVLINVLANRFVKSLGLSLYMDNIGTLLAASLGGYLPGIVVGYLTNLISSTTDPANAYYAVLSVLIAAAGAFFAQRGFFEKAWKALLTIPVFAFLGGFNGTVLTWLIYGIAPEVTFA